MLSTMQFRSVFLLALCIALTCSGAHPLPQPSWEDGVPLASPTVSYSALTGKDYFDTSKKNTRSLSGPLTISMPPGIENEDAKSADAELREALLSNLGSPSAEPEETETFAPMPTGTPRIGFKAKKVWGKAPWSQSDSFVLPSPSPGPYHFSGRKDRNTEKTSFAENVESSLEPSASVFISNAPEVSPTLFMSPAETIGKVGDDNTLPINPIPSVAPIPTASSTPVSGADIVDTILGSLASQSFEPNESAEPVRPPQKSSIAPTPSASSAVTTVAPTPTPKGACFPGDATVKIKGGTVKRMNELRLGDVVQVGSDEYSSIFMFTHKMRRVVTRFVRLHMSSSHSLDLSGTHYLYLNGRLAAAGTARPGDVVLLGNGSVSSVERIEQVWGRGLYNPQTINGNIVVNGIFASTYTMAVEPSAAHALLAPLRFLYNQFRLSTRFAEQRSFGQGYIPRGKPLVV